MRKFKVYLSATAYVTSSVEIEAESYDKASAKAVEYAADGGVSWKYDGVESETIQSDAVEEFKA